MYQFFVPEEQVAESVITILGSDVNHIRNVLRMKQGETVRISTKSGENYLCALKQIEEQSVMAEIVEKMPDTELPCSVYLFQGLPKSDKMELIIQKAVELGVHAVIPVSMKNCVAKLDEKKAVAKQKRWQQIAESAAKQSKRSIVPEITAPMTYRNAVAFAKEFQIKLVPYENERGMTATKEAMLHIKPGDCVGIFIGPEGGFAPEEIAYAKESGMQPISLGNRILRTETAGFTTLAILMYELECRMEG